MKHQASDYGTHLFEPERHRMPTAGATSRAQEPGWVWEFAVDCGAPVHNVAIVPQGVPSYGTPVDTTCAVTRVCRQVRSESLAMLYSLNTFALQFDKHHARISTIRWLDSLGDKVRPIRRFELVGICHTPLWISGPRRDIKTCTVPVTFSIYRNQAASRTTVRVRGLATGGPQKWDFPAHAVELAHAKIWRDALWMQQRIKGWLRATNEHQPMLPLWQTVVRSGSQMGDIGRTFGLYYLESALDGDDEILKKSEAARDLRFLRE